MMWSMLAALFVVPVCEGEAFDCACIDAESSPRSCESFVRLFFNNPPRLGMESSNEGPLGVKEKGKDQIKWGGATRMTH